MRFHQIPVGPMKNFTYLLGDDASHSAAVIDPSWDLDKIIARAEKEQLRITHIFNTHSHSDHTRGNQALKGQTGARIVAHIASPLPKDIVVTDGTMLQLGQLQIHVLHTPGHAPDAICLLVGDKLLTGDTLFVGECGRTDLPGGDAGALYESLFHKLLQLPAHLTIYPGHDYGPQPYSTLAEERRTNYVLHPRTRDEFIAFMATP